MIETLSPKEFLDIGSPIIDVRSPAEFGKGHIPGAFNIPLFTDEERARVGTLYKQEGRDRAVLEGLRYVGPRLAQMVEQAQALAQGDVIAVHCWRGGERSRSVAWLLEKAGIPSVLLLKGGYKQFRKHVLSSFGTGHHFLVIGGYTGSGKTEILALLERSGEQVLDLEGIANHRGSAFGGCGMPEQPGTEHFENLLWSALRDMDRAKAIWIEDESQMIGRVKIPDELYRTMRSSRLFFLDIPVDVRAARLVREYGSFERRDLTASIERIAKRAGPQRTVAALTALSAGDLMEVALLMLEYYDKTYLHGLSKRDPQRVTRISHLTGDPEIMTKELLEHVLASYRE